MSVKWKGTPVPNSGYVENVYFNTNLSIEEVNNLLSKLTYKESSAGIFLSGLLEKPGTYAIAVMTDANKTYYGIIDLANNTNFYIGGDESVKSEMESMAGFWGWNLDIVYPIVINEELPSTTVGNENNLLTSLFSITPFEEVEEKKVIVTKSKLTAIADNIRNQTGTTNEITLDEMAKMQLGVNEEKFYAMMLTATYGTEVSS